MTAVLLTGSRAPVALDLARRFAEEGAFVMVADSQPAISSASSAVGAAYRVPSARFRPLEFAAAVAGIARRHAVDLIVPTCEETFWLAAVAFARPDGSGAASETVAALRDRLFAPPIDVLRRLHDKAEFMTLLDELGVAHPSTEVISSAIRWRRRAEARARGARPPVVVKPAFSRFGTRTLLVDEGQPLPALPRVTREERWLVQERLTGEEYCTYAVAVGGRLTAFVAYRPAWRAGRGAGVAFERLDPASALALDARRIAASIAARLTMTGQFGLDLMMTASGPQVLECNPRATSGLHLFAPGGGLAGAFRGVEAAGPSRATARLGLPLAMYAAPGMRHPADVARWWRLRRSPDALRPPGDRVSVAKLARSIAVQQRTARQAGVSLLAASTHDIEWNGEPLPPRQSSPPLAPSRAAPDAPDAASTPHPHDAAPPSSPHLGAASAPPPASSAAHGRPRQAPPPPDGESVGESPRDWADVFADGMSSPAGTTGLVENVEALVGVVEVDGHRLPVTTPRRCTTRDAPPQSYVVSPLSHYVHYAREELGNLESRAARVVASGVLTVLGRVLATGRIDDVVIVGNALLSTNLLPDVGEAALQRLTTELAAAHPGRAIVWRSVHGRGSRLPDTLRRSGYRLIPSRSVLFTPTRDDEWAGLRDSRRDRATLDASGYRALRPPVDDATGMSHPHVRQRIAELYDLLYVGKYSTLNPRYTADFVGLAQRSGLLDFIVLERNGRIDGVFGFRVAHGLLAAPLVGYDTALPQSAGLYRMLTYLIARTAHEHDVELHNSSGVAQFKRNRGAEAEIEYTAVYTRHLPAPRRAAWALLEIVVRRIAVPLVARDGL
ncbi:ATP-grasp domain-containing protein [Herbiconiux daphne]|uniref:ATP-grasp domain-containing protein n=1 Tax=Herbiconiux daphne TaxID=2970914 RepID=A0ABT2H2C0_9MICO|nr:ATP-grasp domain-containing protein [Herbiconiux daphne]MCS5734057.1 ATP-grasp domain-containing protein [Herbiconiux daphne]